MTLLEMKAQRDNAQRDYREALERRFMEVLSLMARSGESLMAREIEKKYGIPKGSWVAKALNVLEIERLSHKYQTNFRVHTKVIPCKTTYIGKEDPTKEIITTVDVYSYSVVGETLKQKRSMPNKKYSEIPFQQYTHCPEDDGGNCPFGNLPCSVCDLNR